MNVRADGMEGHRVLDKAALESLYAKYNDRRYVSSDPVEFVHRYEQPRDREVAAIVASTLAFGNVKQIGASVARILEPMGSSPSLFLLGSSPKTLAYAFRSFRHRWITGEDVASMLTGVRKAMEEFGSLRRLFSSKLGASDPDVAPAAARFAEYVSSRGEGFKPCLLPSPEAGSACKRLNLFLRWMVRSDEIDPGGWSDVPPSMLIVPLDVHMYRISRKLGLTKRLTADLKTAREITGEFRKVAPTDPVRYDFALTRLGILRGSATKETDLERSYC